MTPVVFATESYGYFQQALCAETGYTSGQVERRPFADGERALRIATDVKDRDAVLVGGTGTDAATLELFDLACGLVGLGVNTLRLVVPYFGYSTQERATRRGEVVTAKTRALLLSAIPRATRANEMILVDLHTPGIAFYFESAVRGFHLSAHALALAVVKEIAAKVAVVVACTDAGRAKWVQGLANDAGLPAAFVYKARQASGKTAVTGVNADVKGKHVVIYDDMVRSGGSLLQAAKAYKAAGAAKVTAVTTHAVLPGDALAQIRKEGLLEALHATDSLPQALSLQQRHGDFLKVRSLAPVVAAHLKAHG